MATFATSHNIGVLDGADKFSDKLMDLSNIVTFIDALRHDVVAARLGTLLETQPVLLTKDGDVILAKDKPEFHKVKQQELDRAVLHRGRDHGGVPRRR